MMKKALRDVGREMTEAQQLMRSEMRRGVHRRAPERLSSVFDQVMGVQRDAAAQRAALKLIESLQPELRLSVAEWQVVTDLVAAAWVAGGEARRTEGLGSLGLGETGLS